MGQVISSVLKCWFGFFQNRKSSTPGLSNPLVKLIRPKTDASEEPNHVINIVDFDYSTPPREDEPEPLNPSTITDVADSAIVTLYGAEWSADVVFGTSPSDLDSTFAKDTGFNCSTDAFDDASEEPNHVINIVDFDYSTPPREDEPEPLNPSTNTAVADSAIITLYDAEWNSDVVFGTISSYLDSTFTKDTGFNCSADTFDDADSLFIGVPDAPPKEEDHCWEESIASTDDVEEAKRVIKISNVVDSSLPREDIAQLKKKNLSKPERWIMHYCSSHSILLVGEGDFSFSTCLSKAFRRADNMVATSLNSKEFLQKNYSQAISNISKLDSRGCKVIHNVDATIMASYDYLNHVKFDRIIYNFPLAGFFPNESRKQNLRRNKELVRLFLKNAKQMVAETGEIHITHKSNGFFSEWNLQDLASKNGLSLFEEVKFNLEDYPGYFTKYGFGGDKNFNCKPSKTYKFQLI